MSTIEKTIVVEVPVRTAYDQWTQFESFPPKFMQGVEHVKQIDDKHLHWSADIAGVHREWDAEIVHQTPDERITWRATDGTTNDGTVSFAPRTPPPGAARGSPCRWSSSPRASSRRSATR